MRNKPIPLILNQGDFNSVIDATPLLVELMSLNDGMALALPENHPLAAIDAERRARCLSNPSLLPFLENPLLGLLETRIRESLCQAEKNLGLDPSGVDLKRFTILGRAFRVGENKQHGRFGMCSITSGSPALVEEWARVLSKDGLVASWVSGSEHDGPVMEAWMLDCGADQTSQRKDKPRI